MTQRPSAPTARITTVTLGKTKEQVPSCFCCSCLHLGAVSVTFYMHGPFLWGGGGRGGAAPATRELLRRSFGGIFRTRLQPLAHHQC